jgi:hypothetical protein
MLTYHLRRLIDSMLIGLNFWSVDRVFMGGRTHAVLLFAIVSVAVYLYLVSAALAIFKPLFGMMSDMDYYYNDDLRIL